MTAEELDDFRAYLSDFFNAFRDAALAEQEMEETFEREAVERMNLDRRYS